MRRKNLTEAIIQEELINMMEHVPFTSIKVKDLVERAEIGRSTFYLYFDSIYSVLQKIEDDLFFKLTSDLDKNIEYLASTIKNSSARTEPEPLQLSAAERIKDNIRLFRVLSGPNGDPTFQARLNTRSRRQLEKYLASKSSLDKAEKQLIIEYATGGQWYMYRWWANHEDEISTHDITILMEKITARISSLMQ